MQGGRVSSGQVLQVRWARSSIGDRSADAQLLFWSHAAPAATAIALVSSVRCWLARACGCP